MNKIISTLILCFALPILLGTASAQAKNGGKTDVFICTYNIRGDLPADTATVNDWRLRRDSLCKIVNTNDFDIVCMQEVQAAQLEDILERTKYSFVGTRGLFNPILYKAEKYELMHTETFWLSESMVPFSNGWDGKYDRYCIWARFRDRKTGQEFTVFNVHLDHRGVLARSEGAELLSAQAEKFSVGVPMFICGDMNCTDDTDAYKNYTKHFSDSRKVAEKVSGEVGTAHNFGKVTPVRIDYIFINDRVKVLSYDIDAIRYPNGMYPSDHRPVFIKAVMTK